MSFVTATRSVTAGLVEIAMMEIALVLDGTGWRANTPDLPLEVPILSRNHDFLKRGECDFAVGSSVRCFLDTLDGDHAVLDTD
jgi:hypothetical protein